MIVSHNKLKADESLPDFLEYANYNDDWLPHIDRNWPHVWDSYPFTRECECINSCVEAYQAITKHGNYMCALELYIEDDGCDDEPIDLGLLILGSMDIRDCKNKKRQAEKVEEAGEYYEDAMFVVDKLARHDNSWQMCAHLEKLFALSEKDSKLFRVKLKEHDYEIV